MVFLLTRKYLEGEIESSKVALQKHSEGVRVHEIVMAAFEKELKTLPEEKEKVYADCGTCDGCGRESGCLGVLAEVEREKDGKK